MISLKCFFPPYLWCFLRKSQKTLNVGKIRKFVEQGVLFRKNRFHLFKSFLYKNGKAQNMPVVTDRLVWILQLNQRSAESLDRQSVKKPTGTAVWVVNGPGTSYIFSVTSLFDGHVTRTDRSEQEQLAWKRWRNYKGIILWISIPLVLLYVSIFDQLIFYISTWCLQCIEIDSFSSVFAEKFRVALGCEKFGFKKTLLGTYRIFFRNLFRTAL